jgi:hypothetical protein
VQSLLTVAQRQVREAQQHPRDYRIKAHANMNLKARQSLDHDIEIGRGGVRLELSKGEYRTLAQP